MLQTLRGTQSEISNLKQLSNDWFNLLLDYKTSEVRLKILHLGYLCYCSSSRALIFCAQDPTKPENVDVVVFGLIRLLHAIVCGSRQAVRREILPGRFVSLQLVSPSTKDESNFGSGVARKIFWTHLFPPRDERVRDFEPSQPIVSPQTRGLLLEVIFSLVEDDPTQFMWLLQDMSELVPVYPNQEGEFHVWDVIGRATANSSRIFLFL
jgi:ubiquitin carboxyl-terminal hydrolase 34